MADLVTIKPGYRTTEFWLSAAASAVGLLLASGAFATEGTWARVMGLLAAALASMGYSVSRGAVKSAEGAAAASGIASGAAASGASGGSGASGVGGGQ